MIDDFERPEKPMYRLEQVCYNCKFHRRKKSNKFSRFGYCILAQYMYPEIKKLDKKQRQLYFDETSIDASCDLHQFRSGNFVRMADKAVGARPQYD